MEKETAQTIAEKAKTNTILESLIVFVLQTFVSEGTAQSALKAAQETDQLVANSTSHESVVS